MQASQPRSYPGLFYLSSTGKPSLPMLALCRVGFSEGLHQDLKPGCCQRARGFLGIPKDYYECLRIHRNPWESIGIPWNHYEFLRIRLNC